MTAELIAALSVSFSFTLLILTGVILSHKRQMFELKITKAERENVKPPPPPNRKPKETQARRSIQDAQKPGFEFRKEGSD